MKKADADVSRILKMDGVGSINLESANQEIMNVPELIEKMGRDKSWSHTVVNTESNSATLICQLPGEGNRQHFHSDWNEWWFIIEGEWEWLVEGVKKRVKKGDIVFIAKNRKHKITAMGDRVAIRLAVSRYDVDHIYDENDY